MTDHRSDAPAHPSGRESGSAYLATLLLLVLLTIVGLSLAVITQTEVFIGGSEKLTTRTYYNAASGVHLMNTYKLVANETGAQEWQVRQRTLSMFGSTLTATEQIQTSPYFPIATRPCNLCMMNDDSALKYVALQSAVTVRAQPLVAGDIGATKRLGATITLDPVLPDLPGEQFAGDQLIDEHDPERVRIQF